MFVPLDRDSAVPLPRQISGYLEELIRRGHLEPGGPLPPTRSFARDLGVNRKTVEAAYDELEARRLVEIRAGRGVRVRRRVPENPALDLPFRPSRSRDPFSADAWLAPETESPPVTDFAGLGPRILNVSSRQLRLLHDEALEARRSPIFSPPPPLGEPALRKAAARHFARCGVLHDADEIAVFPSRQSAVEAILRMFVPRRGLVLLSGPVDPDLGRPLRERGARPVLLPESARELIRVGRRGAPRLLIVTTGASRLPAEPPGPEWRRAALDVARERGIPVLEDVTGLDLAAAPSASPLATLDGTGRVFPLCDLSDEIGGEFAAAVIAGTAKALERIRTGGPDPGAPTRLAQRVLAEALDAPNRTRTFRAVRERRRLLTASVARTLRRRLPRLEGFEFTPAADAVRLELPPGINAGRLAGAAAARGIRLALPRECAARPADGFVLLDLTRHEEGELLEGLRLLGEAFDELEPDHST